MKKTHRYFFRTFRARVTFVLVLAIIFVAGACNLFIYKYALDSQFQQLREKLMIIAQTAALSIDADLLMKIPLNKEGIRSEAYQDILKKMIEFKQVDPTLKYVYTMKETDKDGVWQFIVDPDAAELEAEGITSYPGDTYDITRFPEMVKSLNGPSADMKLGFDEWGAILSGYAPIRDTSGKTVGIIGVDINAEDVRLIQWEVHKREALILLFGIVLALALGFVLSERMTRRLNTLVEGTRRIKDGDFRYQVKVKGGDEISELAHAFNMMSKSLFLSRKKMHKYFYRVMQSLVRILEAKDVYTSGHSDRVADYAARIALRLGLPDDEIDLLKDAARLHDIGKLGIQKAILNKKEKLTEEEWKIIQEHPVTGADILRPVVFDKQMLAIVRYHHERYDGTGYPDRLTGNAISRLTRIISIADAYDAMTSERPYRKSLTPDQAIMELKTGRGVQFDPEITDVFIQCLRDNR